MNIINWSQIIPSLVSFLSDEYVTIFVSILIIYFISRAIKHISSKFVHDDRKRYQIQKSIRYITTIITIVWILLLYTDYTGNNTSFPIMILGIFLAGIAFSMRDLFSNIVGWGIIASHNGYQSGDRIEIDTIRGDVIDIGVLRTIIAEIGDWDEHGEHSTGRLISIPNSMVLNKPVVNYNRGFETIWNEISIIVTFESDWEKAEELIESIAQEHYNESKEDLLRIAQKGKREFMVNYNYLTPKVYTRIVDSGIRLTLRHMVEARKRRTVNDEIHRKILVAFSKEPFVDFAYNTIRVYKQNEGNE